MDIHPQNETGLFHLAVRRKENTVVNTFWPKVVLFCEKRAAQRVDVGNTGVELMPE